LQIEPESAHLDALIAKLKDSGEAELLVEHLQTAHAYLLGAMPMECVHNLKLTQNAADSLSDHSLRDEVKSAIAELLHALESSVHGHDIPPVPKRVRATTANGLSDFFHGDDTSFGIFYPKKHVVAVFPSFDEAQAGYKILSRAGFRMWEIVAVPGAEVESFLEGIRLHRALWDELVTEISRLLDTEINLVEHYAQWAGHGHGFLVARCTSSDAAENVAQLLDPLQPIAMHWFMSGYIRHLTEGN
jgi:hypothetical protein